MPEEREQHPAPATTKNGQREYTPDPAPGDIVRNFGRPYTDPQPESES